MDKIIDLTRQLGKAIQEDDRFVRYMLASQAREEDEEIEALMESFEEKRRLLNLEMQKEEKDTEAVKALDSEVRVLYDQIIRNEKMTALTNTQQELQEMIRGINQVIQGSANGENPDEIDFTEACAAGDCSSCSGC